ncbi:MAG: hypothetical protein M3680_30670 [Myxococcota bacterium]|nr:hypothetical protein [Myxococcota bacterium]
MTRLETIATRQRNGRLRDAMFAAFLGLAVMLGAVTVGSTLQAASTHVTQR